MIKVEELYWQVMSHNSKNLHDIMGIPLAERIPIMDALKTQTKSLATKEEQFRLIMGEFRKASAQNQSPDPIQLMEQVNVIYPNMI